MTPRQEQFAIKREQALGLWRDGWTSFEIADIVGVARETVCKWAGAAGLQRDPGWRARATLAQTLQLLDELGTQKAVADELGISPQAVSQRLRRLDDSARKNCATLDGARTTK